MIALWISLFVIQAVALIVGNVVLGAVLHDWTRAAIRRRRIRRSATRSGTVRFPVPPMGRHRS